MNNNLGVFLRRTDLIDNIVRDQELLAQKRRPNRSIQEANKRRQIQYQEILRAELESRSMHASLASAAAGGSYVTALVGSLQNRCINQGGVIESISCLQTLLYNINQI